MKRLLPAAVLLLVAPVFGLALLAGAYATSNPDVSTCPTSATPASAGRPSAILTSPARPSAAPSNADPASTDLSNDCGSVGPQGPASAFTGPDGLVDDPTSAGRITRRMLHTYNEVQRVFNGWKWGTHCWDPHIWNPTSDHPLGRACDFTVGHIGTRPTTAQRAVGWQLAHWAQANATALGISYIIFDGHIWSPARSHEGWRPYNGGGIYDPTSVTGGHYDHVHISVIPKDMTLTVFPA